jgi:hypothetical protein
MLLLSYLKQFNPPLPKQMEKNHKSIFSPWKDKICFVAFFCQQLFSWFWHINTFSNTVKLGYNEHSVITNEYFGPKCLFTTQINPVMMNPGPEMFVITEFHCIMKILSSLRIITNLLNISSFYFIIWQYFVF